MLQERCSTNYECGTPQKLFDNLNYSWGPFDLDPCASKDNHKCPNYYTKEDDGLSHEWYGTVFCNPPYGLEIPKWINKIVSEIESGHCDRIVCLLPARTDTKWFHKLIESDNVSEVYFVKGRIKFEGFEQGAKFPSLIAVFDRRPVAIDFLVCDTEFNNTGLLNG